MPGTDEQQQYMQILSGKNRERFIDELRAAEEGAGFSSGTDLAAAICTLTAEVKGLRDDIRREILQREVSKLPQPIQEEVK